MKRRTVLKALAGGVMVGPAALARKNVSRSALMGRGGALKKLVVLFQRGGNDGLNSLIPIDPGEYALYQNLRPNVGIPLANITSVNASSFFGVHQSLNPLVSIMNAGNLSMIHAVGYPSPDRSHFESQSFYETAIPGNSISDGWLNRLLTNTTGPGLIRGVSIGSNIPQSVTGTLAVPVSNNFGNSSVEVDWALNGTEADDHRQKMRDLLALPHDPGSNELYTTGSQIFQMVDSFANRNLNDYVPENGATYPTTGLGRRVMHAAQMLKDDSDFLGIEVVTINQDGYDTHANQLNPSAPVSLNTQHARLLRELADSMRAFYFDMGATRMNDITFMVVTEFGRRAFQNDSNGTDHGTGALVMVMGNGVNGNIINGDSDWPGLNNLVGGDLDWVTDYRDIYWEILSTQLGLDNTTLGNIIPAHTYSPVGFV